MSNSNAHHYRFGDLTTETPIPGIKRRRVIGERAMVSEVYVEKGYEVPWHHHPNEQMALVLEDRLQFDVAIKSGETQRYILEAGDILHLPGNLGHGGVALENCRIIDIFSPPSETAGIDPAK